MVTSSMNSSPFPLAAGIAVPIVLIIPTSILLYVLYNRIHHDDRSPDNVKGSGNGASKVSLASLDVRPFFNNHQRTPTDARAGDDNSTPTVEVKNAENKVPSRVRFTLFSYALGILLSLIFGLIYLACSTSATPSRAIDFPLGISVLLVPSLVLPHSIEGTFKRTGNTSNVRNAARESIFRRIVLPLVGTVAVAALGAWISTYIVVAALVISLLSITFLALDTSKWPLPLMEPRDTIKRHTKSWFSGNALSEADAEALAGQGNMPRPGETEDAFLERMQQEGNSWITENGKFRRLPDNGVT
jgi:hypothetical protein